MNTRAIVGALGVVIILGTLAAAVVAGDQEKPAAGLTQEQALRAKVQVLSEELAEMQKTFAQCRADASAVQAKLDSVVLTVQNQDLKRAHDALEAEIKKALGGNDADAVDWSTSPPTLKKKT